MVFESDSHTLVQAIGPHGKGFQSFMLLCLFINNEFIRRQTNMIAHSLARVGWSVLGLLCLLINDIN